MSQTNWILEQLQKGRSLTPADAMAGCRCFRLAARINDLKAKGHKIVTVMIEENGTRFASYNLMKGKRNGQ